MMNIPAGKLESYIENIFLSVGLNQMEAFETAHHLVHAELKGISSHGVQRVSIYVKRVKCGIVQRDVSIQVERETPISLSINANNGIGPYVARKALDLGIEKAIHMGICAVGIYNSNHAGVLSYYTEMAVGKNLIALATTNAPSNMAPYGGKVKYFGTNPFSFAVPSGHEHPFILDMATSVVAKGKIIQAMKENRSIPPGWAIDQEGNETTDAKAAFEGLVMPLGGAKGYGLAFMVDILSGILTGANWGPHINDLYSDFQEPQNAGQFFILFRPDLFLEMSEFKSRMDQAIQEIHSIERAPGFSRIYIPGEMESELYRRRIREGVPLGKEIIHELMELGNALGINGDFLMAKS